MYLLGGTSAIPASIATELAGMGYRSVRFAGADRYGTAVAVADALGDPQTVLLATGTNYPDALAAGPAAAHIGGAVLLTDGSGLPAATAGYLSTHPAGSVYAIGGPAAVADPLASRVIGADRYATASAIAATFFTAPATVGVATGLDFPDALSGGPMLAESGAPLLLTLPNALPSETATYLASIKSTALHVDLFGGTGALNADIPADIETALS